MLATSTEPMRTALPLRFSSTARGLALSRANNTVLIFGRPASSGTVTVEIPGLRSVTVWVAQGVTPFAIVTALKEAFRVQFDVFAEANRYGDAGALFLEDRRFARQRSLVDHAFGT